MSTLPFFIFLCRCSLEALWPQQSSIWKSEDFQIENLCCGSVKKQSSYSRHSRNQLLHFTPKWKPPSNYTEHCKPIST